MSAPRVGLLAFGMALVVATFVLYITGAMDAERATVNMLMGIAVILFAHDRELWR